MTFRKITPNDFDVLSAAWVFACNDDNELITYEGIKHRLGLPANYDVQRLIRTRGELFRQGVTRTRLGEWKNQLIQGKNVPSWIRELDDEKRTVTIYHLRADDVFRSQFRAERRAERTSIEIVEWGLRHIDRLRKAGFEEREQRITVRQVWLIAAIGVLNILVTLVVK